ASSSGRLYHSLGSGAGLRNDGQPLLQPRPTRRPIAPACCGRSSAGHCPGAVPLWLCVRGGPHPATGALGGAGLADSFLRIVIPTDVFRLAIVPSGVPPIEIIVATGQAKLARALVTHATKVAA